MIKKTLTALLAFCAAVSFAAVDVNNASVADLDSIKGIGPGTSSKILDARKSAKFKDWNDLIHRVGGIGDKRATQLSSQGLTVNGATYTRTSPPKPGKTTVAKAKKAENTSLPMAPVSAAPAKQ